MVTSCNHTSLSIYPVKLWWHAEYLWDRFLRIRDIILTPWVLCWHIRICHCVATPLSAVLTYTYMSWYYLWGKLHKIGSSKDFLMNFVLFACCFAKESTGKQTENIATIFHTKNNTPFRWKRKKHQKLSTVGWSFDLNVSSQGVNIDQLKTSLPDCIVRTFAPLVIKSFCGKSVNTPTISTADWPILS